MFEGLAEKAEQGWQDPGQSSATQNQETNTEAQSQSAQSYDTAPELRGDKPQQNEQSFDKQPQGNAQTTEQMLADLTKYEKVRLPDGTEMSRDELTRAIMRQQDYTKKTQELAKERRELEEFKTRTSQESEQFKYQSNYTADFRKIQANPALLSEFFETYPKEYHAKILSDLQRMGQESQNKVDPVYAKALQRQHEFESELKSLKEERHQENIMFVDSRLKSLESTLSQKYPKADMSTVYAQLDIEAQRQGVDIQAIKANPQLLDQTMEKLAKDSHERYLKSYEEYAKEQSKKQIEANKKGSDIGRGGGAPNSPPTKTKLKDVDMVAAMRAAGQL